MHNIINKKPFAMINSWYLNGFNKQKIIGEDGSFPLFIDELGIAAKIELITYVSQTKRLFFVVPEYPEKIISSSIEEYLRIKQPNFINAKKRYDDITSIDNTRGSIIALTSSSKHLFFLTCDIGRKGGENSYTLHMYDTDQETGFGMERIESIIDFTHLLQSHHKPLSISVAERRTGIGYRIYFYGKSLDGTVIFANFSSQPKITPRLLNLKKMYGVIPKIDFVHPIDNSKQKPIKSLKPSTLLVVDSAQNFIYMVNHYKEDEVKMIPLGRIGKKDADIVVTAISRLKLSINDQNMGYESSGSHYLFLFAEEKSNSIYSLHLDNTKVIFNVIGGGNKDIGKNKCRNFNMYNISSLVNNIVSIENFGFIAGKRATNSWFALLLPSAIEEKKISGLRKKYIPRTPTIDNYSS